ncbi:hypothetical protein XO10_08620 [Marinitoga sp. 1135]|uniref:Uncharacterized protein n=1 Tax=Marinitoga piezophila (strain DSM 14283 / JCM 11233 / KA3) TaxID=443254 RepID=H2J5J0_MARPK|nr:MULTISPECIES: hypothetical protein [Marinitoga]AEX86134.1 hypothetical protein Marpi_1748 [Marinitoga piezophila KA3]APT76549.1 hypothetical protein LN42_09300 [Marinitoga sp. 1137]NUU96318.1 hypothetical protein [Marinitoga sp. 1135]NUU98236.1 hypothetical protein [Marinitoga sp. 1138]
MATLKIRPEKKPIKKKRNTLSEHLKTIKAQKSDEEKIHKELKKLSFSSNAGVGWLKIVFSSFNFLISLFLISIILFINFEKELLQSMLGTHFSFETKGIMILGILFLLYSIIEQFNAIYYLKESLKWYRITCILKFIVSLLMIFSIVYLISKSGIQWFGISLFGNTTLGKNKLFYIPSIVYLTYSIYLSLLSYYDLLK